MCSRCEHTLVFPWDQRGLLLLGVPSLLVGSVYHVKNEGCLFEVFIMRLFNQTLSIYSRFSGHSAARGSCDSRSHLGIRLESLFCLLIGSLTLK